MPLDLSNDTLVFSFPEIHADAMLRISFQRTLRVPDDGQEHFLPPGLGNFPVRDTDALGTRAPAASRRAHKFVRPPAVRTGFAHRCHQARAGRPSRTPRVQRMPTTAAPEHSISEPP